MPGQPNWAWSRLVPCGSGSPPKALTWERWARAVEGTAAENASAAAIARREGGRMGSGSSRSPGEGPLSRGWAVRPWADRRHHGAVARRGQAGLVRQAHGGAVEVVQLQALAALEVA